MSGIDEYLKAQKLGLKDLPANSNINDGKSALPVLDDILKDVKTAGEDKIGLEQIPLSQIVGTKSKGRTNAFAPNFMPVLNYDTEFGQKWASLCEAHIEEGIRDPIICYEYMNKYYVVEGNKRVSVLKYFDAVSIPGIVTRIIPEKNDDPENVIYYEYMKFNRHSKINYLLFSQKGSYQKLLNLLEKDPEEDWTDEEIINFNSAYARFQTAYLALRRSTKLNITTSDAFLTFLNIYGYEDVCNMVPAQIKNSIPKIWEEFELLDEDDSVKLMLTPAESEHRPNKIITNISNILSGSSRKKIAFIHAKNADTSSWTYAHELGRMYLEQVFPTEIETTHVDDVTLDNADQVMEDLIEKGYNILFTTTANLVQPSLRIAVKYPDAKVFNCSLNMSHRYIRTYYARMYEAKFISGAIAGALTDTDHIGYISTYPIYGMTANINAFALGAKMTNPRVKVHLAWSCLKDQDIYQQFRDHHISHISEQDMITPQNQSKAYGLIRFAPDGEVKNLCTTIWDWGKLYERIISGILSGTWKKDPTDGSKAVNYWWGLSSNVIDIVLSREVSPDTRRMVNLLKKAISDGDFNPFSGILTDQNGNAITSSETDILTPDEIMKMNWLNENIIGSIPKKEDLTDETIKLIEVQGIIE